MKELISSLCLLSGSLFFFISVLGILKFPDVFTRMHSAAKASSLGLTLILIGVIFHFTEGGIIIKCIFIILFTFLTAPVSAQILSRTAYRSGAQLWQKTVIDEVKSSNSKKSPE